MHAFLSSTNDALTSFAFSQDYQSFATSHQIYCACDKRKTTRRISLGSTISHPFFF